MNNKIPFHELAAKVAAATGISPESAGIFVKNFFETISESLVKGESVKVKGLGTFSVSESKGEKAIDFVLDKEMSDAINAPFAIFDPVILNEEVSDEMLSEVDREINTESEPEPEQAPETIPQQEEDVKTETVVNISPEPEKTPAVDNGTDLIVEEQTSVAESDKDENDSDEPNASEDNGTDDDIVNKEAKEERVVPVIQPLEEDPVEYVDRNTDVNSGSKSFWWGLCVGLVVGLALGACGVYFAVDHIFNDDNDEIVAEEVDEGIIEGTEPDSIATIVQSVADTLNKAENDAQHQTTPESTIIGNTEMKPSSAEVVRRDTIKRGYLIHDMAKKFYGSKDFWVYIYEENKSKIGNPNTMQAGVVLVIPAAEKYGISADDPESIRRAKNKAGEILSKYPR